MSDARMVLSRRAVLGLSVLMTLGTVACNERRAEEKGRARKAEPRPSTRPGARKARKPTGRTPGKEKAVDIAAVRAKLAKFVPTTLDFDDKRLDASDKKVVALLVEAAREMDRLFLVQVDGANPKVRAEIAAQPQLKDVLAYFDIMFGPWDRLDHDKPFYGTRKKPLGAGFYPEDMTKAEFDAWIKAHPDQAEAFKSYFTVIRRQGKKLLAVPFSKAYARYLTKAAKLLREAAAQTKDARLRRYLELRAKAFETNDYRESDMAWMDLGDGKLEVVIGPYEVYEDRLFGYKASFEAFICLRDQVYSARLQKIARHKVDMEKALPIEDRYKNFKRGSSLPITVVDEIFTAGDTKAGVQTLAFNLPNDEIVRQKKGYKLVLLKNVAEAKFKTILMPIASRLMDKDQLGLVTFDSFFMNTLMHETAHGQGPGRIVVIRDGKKVETDVNRELKDLYSTIEEAKADMTGLYLSSYLIGKGVLPKDLADRVYASYLAGFFRAIRFGAGEAHGRANLISFNYLTEKGAIRYDSKTGHFRLDFGKVRGAVKDLVHDLLMLEAKGDYEATKKFVAKYGQMAETLKKGLARLTGIPVDIRPHYAVEDKLAAWKKAGK